MLGIISGLSAHPRQIDTELQTNGYFSVGGDPVSPL